MTLHSCNLTLAGGSCVTDHWPFPILSPPPLTYWEGRALLVPLLAKVGVHVYSIVPSEAAVERSFSNQTILHSELRNRMTEKTINDLMYVRMNVGHFFEVPQVPSAKKMKVEAPKQ